MCISGTRPLLCGQKNVTINEDNVSIAAAEELDKKLLYSEEALERGFRKE